MVLFSCHVFYVIYFYTFLCIHSVYCDRESPLSLSGGGGVSRGMYFIYVSQPRIARGFLFPLFGCFSLGSDVSSEGRKYISVIIPFILYFCDVISVSASVSVGCPASDVSSECLVVSVSSVYLHGAVGFVDFAPAQVFPPLLWPFPQVPSERAGLGERPCSDKYHYFFCQESQYTVGHIDDFIRRLHHKDLTFNLTFLRTFEVACIWLPICFRVCLF